jgi:hypothetical protein
LNIEDRRKIANSLYIKQAGLAFLAVKAFALRRSYIIVEEKGGKQREKP